MFVLGVSGTSPRYRIFLLSVNTVILHTLVLLVYERVKLLSLRIKLEEPLFTPFLVFWKFQPGKNSL